MSVSIIIRTYNEARRLPEVLSGIRSQLTNGLPLEIILVDSGSTDSTVQVALEHGCRILHIDKEEFTFGRSLNVGCEASRGNYLVFLSGHCVPVDEHWLSNLLRPLERTSAEYCYGRQIGNGESRYSERQLFGKFYPDSSTIPQDGYFVNNANAAIPRQVWAKYRFDEQLTGLEDMALGKRIVGDGGRIAYVANAVVYHLHDERWQQIRWRFEREAIALQSIMPEVQISSLEVLRFFVSAVVFDSSVALRERKLLRTLPEICMFRFMQFWGTYQGNHEHKKLSKAMKEKYFYPKQSVNHHAIRRTANSGPVTDKGS